METKIINLTPHPINVCGIAIPPEAVPARCKETTKQFATFEFNGAKIPVVTKTFEDVEGLPEDLKPDTYYVVSRIVAEAARNRSDLLVPGDLERDAAGNITGCKSLCLV